VKHSQEILEVKLEPANDLFYIVNSMFVLCTQPTNSCLLAITKFEDDIRANLGMKI
jgi:hypothetical protein